MDIYVANATNRCLVARTLIATQGSVSITIDLISVALAYYQLVSCSVAIANCELIIIGHCRLHIRKRLGLRSA